MDACCPAAARDGPFHEGVRWRCAGSPAGEEQAQPITASPRLFLSFPREGDRETSFHPRLHIRLGCVMFSLYHTGAV